MPALQVGQFLMWFVLRNHNARNYFVQAFKSSGFANGPLAISIGCIF